METTPQPKFLDAAALEIRYSCHRSAFPRWQRLNGFPKPRYLGHRRLWLLSELEAWEAVALAPEPSQSAKNLTPNTGEEAQP
jgi:predicted DNA-binding transcriptional regulator AlpA